jgi:N-acyl-D-aspartate/D-glutamate deacylase
MAQFDVVIRGGTVVDGTGAPPRTADVAIRDGRVVAVGDGDEVAGTATREVEADGALVTPGWVDIHTHYDGQATWDDQLLPSPWHGVTTVVFGNCGVGFAPVRHHDHERLIELMEGVEDIPGAALHEGLTWEWESFPEYLDAIDRRPHDIDLAAQVPHGALRLYVMGERGANRDEATAEEIADMGELVRQAVEAGAIGFTTSRTLNHKTSRGEPTPTLTASEPELVGIASAMGASGKGVLALVSDFLDVDHEFSIFRHMAEASGRPLSISIAQADRMPDQWRKVLDHIAAANADGLEVRSQVAARAIGALLGLQATQNPFRMHARFAALGQLPLAEQLATLRDPGFRTSVMADEEALPDNFRQRFEKMFRLGDPPDYEPRAEDSLAAEARRRGVKPWEVAYDALLEDDGRNLLYVPFLNYAGGDLEVVRAMHLDPYSVPGLSDGGAHVGTICDASFPTSMLTHWVRDRTRGDKLELAHVVRRQTRETARAVGLLDRGTLEPGMKADVNVIDFDALTLHKPEMVFDLPAGGKRLLQRAEGYRHTFVSGTEVYADGVHTGALPGALVRGHQPAPTR